MNQLEMFLDNYEELFSGQYDVGRKQFVGDNPPVLCRFCGKRSPEVSFNNEAHAIPELLGNRQLVVTDECDKCNEMFAKQIEDHLGKFTKPFRVISHWRGKDGVPSYKTPKKLSRIDVMPSEGLVIKQQQGDPILEFIEGENRARLNFVIEKHVPSAVYKALVKIALSVMPLSEMEQFKPTKAWILHKDHTKPILLPLKLLLYFIPGHRPHRRTSILLLKKKHDSGVIELPNYIQVLTFGNLQLQIMIPSIRDNRKESDTATFIVPRFPSAFGDDWPFGRPEPEVVDLSSGEIAASSKKTFNLVYGEMEEIDSE